jgi:hypothetical protein
VPDLEELACQAVGKPLRQRSGVGVGEGHRHRPEQEGRHKTSADAAWIAVEHRSLREINEECSANV